MSLEQNIQLDDLIDFKKVASLIWQFKWRVFLVILLTTTGSVIYSQLATRYYVSSVLLQPVSNDNNKSFSGLSSSLGGLGSLVGVSTGNSKTAANLAYLTSRVFLTQFIEKNKLLPILFPEINLDNKKRKIPDLLDAYEKLINIITINNDKKTGLITLVIEWENPQQASEWANLLVMAANEYLREDAIKETQNSIRYLQKMSAETQELEIRQVIYQLLASEIQNMKIANIRADYAFKVIDPAVPPKLAIKPQKRKLVLLGFFCGVFLSILACLLISIYRDKNILKQ